MYNNFHNERSAHPAFGEAGKDQFSYEFSRGTSKKVNFSTARDYSNIKIP